MHAPARLGPRLARALLLGGSGIALGSMAHLEAAGSGSGTMAAPALVGASLVLTLAWVATARRVSWPVIALVLAAGQVIIHSALVMGTGVPGVGGSHTHGSGPSLTASTTADPRMLALHVTAWVLLTWAFTLGERALWRSVERLAAGVTRAWSPPPRPRSAGAAPVTPASVLAPGTIRGRAPPVF
ncbi:hypothetical protein GA707_00145 [Nostocoides sp. F2B08]|uniref:hypothetical protein n=1 Tax=Nostocoides sp. F2B08 TaxID=2653936 RepID=UPI0012630A4B|nr:hypothetical protein [Tetrasphaera sp. F2B08]KAB7745994.1 hypothetical protein GA707_00145 [Tetrasphaera sp. F2B08]